MIVLKTSLKVGSGKGARHCVQIQFDSKDEFMGFTNREPDLNECDCTKDSNVIDGVMFGSYEIERECTFHYDWYQTYINERFGVPIHGQTRPMPIEPTVMR